jgi:hypothetical protein
MDCRCDGLLTADLLAVRNVKRTHLRRLETRVPARLLTGPATR